VQDEPAAIERSQRGNRSPREAQIGFVAVFDDGFAVARGDLDQSTAVIDRSRRAEWVVEGRNRVEDLDFGARENPVECVEVESGLSHGDGRNLESKTVGRCEHVVVRRLFDRDGVARLREQPQAE